MKGWKVVPFSTSFVLTVLCTAPLVIDGALRTLLWVPLAALGSALALVGAFMLQRVGYFVLKGVFRYAIRRVVMHLVSIYVVLHPGLTNAQVRKLYTRVLREIKVRFRKVRSVHRAFSVVALVSAWIGLTIFLVWIGALHILYSVLKFMGEIIAKTAFGRALHAGVVSVTRKYFPILRAHFGKAHAAYRRANLRLLRRMSRRYRALHNGTKNGDDTST